MKRTISLKNIKIKTNSQAEKIYPKHSYRLNGKEHKTTAIKFTREQAVDTARNLLIAAKEWDEIYLTAFRNANSINVTVTSQKEIDDEDE